METVSEQLTNKRQIPTVGILALCIFAVYIIMTAQEKFYEIIQPDLPSFLLHSNSSLLLQETARKARSPHLHYFPRGCGLLSSAQKER